MRISSIQMCKTTNVQFFGSQHRKRRVHQPRRDYTTETYYEAYNGEIKKMDPSLKTKIAAIAAAAAIAGSGIGGYTIGKNQNQDEVYLEAYDRGWKDAIVQMEKDKNIREFQMPVQTASATPTPSATPSVVEKVVKPVPEKVYAIATGNVQEYDLGQKPFVYRENMKLPDYFTENHIDENVLKAAQSSMARVFKSGGYMILSPNQEVTMGELKRVFGILDGVIGKDPANELNTRPQTPGSNGNLDEALVGVNDAIRIKLFDKNNGHQIGVYTAHKSNKSRQKIADEIIEWANK